MPVIFRGQRRCCRGFGPPDAPEVLHALAIVCKEIGDLLKAQGYFEKAVRRAPASEENLPN